MKRFLTNPIKIVLVIATVLLGIFVSNMWHSRFDLTSEKRYTLSKTTKDMLGKLSDNVTFTVYLDGDLPVSFFRLKREIHDMLDEFQEYGNGHIEFNFVNPSQDDNGTSSKQYNELIKNNLLPYTIQEKDEKGKQTERVVFPGALLALKQKVIAINFLKASVLQSTEQNINSSVENIEYELINAIRKISIHDKQKIAFITNHGELDKNDVADISKALEDYYVVDRMRIDSSVDMLKPYKTIIIAKPMKAFNEADKFAIDQFVMNGGKVLWLLDFVNVPEDSLRYQRMVLGLANQVNLDDQLFKYGVRVNYNLILDNQCAIIPLNVAAQGAQPQFNPAPWFYYPLLTPTGSHPITKNVNVVRAQFASVLDTVGDNAEVKKKILLRSSQYSKVLATPIPVSFDILNQEPNQYFFDKYNLPVAVLLEGTFHSVFANRMPRTLHNHQKVQVVKQSKPSAMIVIADGDIIRNDVHKLAYDTIPLPLGYDRYTKETYGNKDFLLNAINYLCDDGGLLSVRSRELKLRLLNKTRIVDERTQWQIITILLPLLLVAIFGIIITFVRRYIYK